MCIALQNSEGQTQKINLRGLFGWGVCTIWTARQWNLQQFASCRPVLWAPMYTTFHIQNPGTCATLHIQPPMYTILHIHKSSHTQPPHKQPFTYTTSHVHNSSHTQPDTCTTLHMQPHTYTTLHTHNSQHTWCCLLWQVKDCTIGPGKIAVKVWRPELGPLALLQRLSAAVCACCLSTGEAEAGAFLGLAGQPPV